MLSEHWKVGPGRFGGKGREQKPVEATASSSRVISTIAQTWRPGRALAVLVADAPLLSVSLFLGLFLPETPLVLSWVSEAQCTPALESAPLACHQLLPPAPTTGAGARVAPRDPGQTQTAKGAFTSINAKENERRLQT